MRRPTKYGSHQGNDNLFFRSDDVVFFDWQMVQESSCAYDVAYFLSSALEADSATVETLLDQYHDALCACGVADYSRQQLGLEYRCALRVILANLLTIDQVELGDGRGEQLMGLWHKRLLGLLRHAAAS